jgi:hypothetical protein
LEVLLVFVLVAFVVAIAWLLLDWFVPRRR